MEVQGMDHAAIASACDAIADRLLNERFDQAPEKHLLVIVQRVV
jgi:hypothetical protein